MTLLEYFVRGGLAPSDSHSGKRMKKAWITVQYIGSLGLAYTGYVLIVLGYVYMATYMYRGGMADAAGVSWATRRRNITTLYTFRLQLL